MAINLNGIDLSAGAATSAQKSASSAQSTSAQSAATSSAADAAAQKPQSEVNITSTAALLARIQQTLGAQPAVDQSRVDAISKALAGGTYKVDPDRIANGLLSTEQALGKLQR